MSAIITRIRGDRGAVPLVVSYDDNEKLWNPPMPLLFQRRLRSEDRPITAQAVRELLNIALDQSGLTDAAGQPLRFAPHDFRRLLITDAIMHGMPPHIAQLVAWHRDISTTMGYKAVYPEEVIGGHRAFIARTPTDAEWEEFLGHFERRKLALGDCGRAYGTSCIHELHPVPAPAARPSPARPAPADPDQPARPHRRSRTRGLARRSRRTEGQPRRRRRQAHPDRRGPAAASHHGPARHASIPRHPSVQRRTGQLTIKPDNKA
jgi:hypothetical protein